MSEGSPGEPGSKEPLWRTVLCWSAVFMFFSMPAIVFTLHVLSIELGWRSDERWSEFHGVSAVYQTVTALVFGLAGLQSFDRFVTIKNGSKTQKEKSPGQSGP